MADRNLRLPVQVRPRIFTAELWLELERSRFRGAATIDLEIDGAQSSILLHAVGLTLDGVEVQGVDGPCAVRGVVPQPASQTVRIDLGQPLPPGEAKLSLRWHGAFSDGLRGLYWADEVAVTQFEAADARRVFPCFDEPRFKPRWALTLHGVPDSHAAISNGAITQQHDHGDGQRTIAFGQTPPLPSYLIAMVIGELSASAVAMVEGVPVRTWAVPSKRHLVGFGQEVAAAVLPRLRIYFGLPYAFGKLDQIAVPDFEPGAMENAGAVTYRETALLLDPGSAPLRVQKVAAEVITHELAHQWFGNLVTMEWWDDLWLNEAFATWMGYKIVDEWRPQWRIWMDFAGGVEEAFALDSLESSHPVRSPVENAEQAGESFDAITYEKGAAVLRMLEGFLGPESFRAGIREYMVRHREANATATDLWEALEHASGQPVTSVIQAWIDGTGFPLLRLGLDHGDHDAATITVQQRRFLFDASKHRPGRWSIPAVFRYCDDEGIKEHRVLIEDVQQAVKLPARGDLRWCLANREGRGFYRTAYDPELERCLLGSLQQLDPIERMGLVSDHWACVRSGDAEIGTFLDLVDSLREEPDRVVIDTVTAQLGTLEASFVPEADRDAFHAFVTGLFEPRMRVVGWDASAAESDEQRLLRVAVARGLTLVAREPEAVARAASLLDALLEDPQDAPGFDANLLDVVVVAGARVATPQRFEKLCSRLDQAVDPAVRRRYLHAIARIETKSLCPRVVDLMFDARVGLQDFPSYVTVLLRNRVTRGLAWRTILERWDRVQGRIGAPMLRHRFITAMAALNDDEQLEQVREFLRELSGPGTEHVVAQTLEQLQLDVELRRRIQPGLHEWLQRTSAIA